MTASETKKRETILIVDDDPMTLRLLEHHLRPLDYDIITAASAEAAIDRLSEGPPSIIVTDWGMPGISGPEFCHHIRAAQESSGVYTIALALDKDRDLMRQAFEAGADDYLTKPFNKRELLARVRAGARIVELERSLARTNGMIRSTNRMLADANQALERMANTDDLTGLANRRAAMATLEEQWRSAAQEDRRMACLLLDVDDFKRVNDTYGHEIGDRVLRTVARRLRETSRGTEEVFRLGGEEFLILCPRATAAMATSAAKRMREAIETLEIESGDDRLQVTASIGVAERSPEMRNEDHLIRAAEFARDDAKSAGRNCVRVAPTAPHALPEAERESEDRGRASA